MLIFFVFFCQHNHTDHDYRAANPIPNERLFVKNNKTYKSRLDEAQKTDGLD
jgi:hypothetical protein